MPDCRRLWETRHRLGRLAALVAATTLAAGTVALTGTTPASAQIDEGEGTMTLAYDSPYGTYASDGVTANSPIDIDISPGTWDTLLYSSSYSEDDVTGFEIQFLAVTTNGNTDGLCLADTGGNAYLAGCGDNGTYWIAVASGTGYYLYNKYELNRDAQYVLAANNPSGSVPAYIVEKSTLVTGDGIYARWAIVI
jgi:hypothetical protein